MLVNGIVYNNANKWTSIQLLNNSIVKATPQGQMIKPDTKECISTLYHYSNRNSLYAFS